MSEIHLYGNLRRLISNRQTSGEGVIRIDPNGGETVQSMLDRIGIHSDQVSTIFVNSKLFVTRNNASKAYGFVQLGDDPLAWDLSKEVEDRDRIGLFGRDVPLMV